MKPFDLQVNGYAGADFCSASLTAEDLHRACEALRGDGCDAVLATVITAPVDRMAATLENLVRLRAADALAAEVVGGLHVEGPFLNPEPGYIGAHPRDAAKAANIDDADRLLEAGGGLVKVFTLAPETDPGGTVTRFLHDRGVVVSAGHTNAGLDTLRAAIDQGLGMATHLGNGCPLELPRHDNIIQRILSLREHLWIGMIPDGIHVDFFALRNYLDLVGLERAFLVTDAISAAGLGPGIHELSGAPVEVDAAGAARRPGSANLAGSTLTMRRLRENLGRHLGLGEDAIRQLIDVNPRKALAGS